MPKLSCIFVSSSFQSWQGLDLLLKSYINTPAIKLVVVGKVLTSDIQLVRLCQRLHPHTFTYHESLSSNDLINMYRDQDIGISTLALSRKGMKQACPLKSREYMRNGLPVVGGYEDPEITFPFYQQISASVEDIVAASKNTEHLRSIDIIDYARSHLSRSLYIARLN